MIQGPYIKNNVNCKVMNMEINLNIVEQNQEETKSSEMETEHKKAKIFFIQIPSKGAFCGEYQKQITNDYRALKKTIPELEIGMSIQSDTKQLSPEMMRITDYIVLDMISVISIESFDSIITNTDTLRRLLKICREHNVEVINYKGKNIREEKEMELAVQEVFDLSLIG